MNWLLNTYTKAKAAVVALWNRIPAPIQHDLELYGAALFQIAVGAVTKQIPLLIAGTEKFSAAVADTISTAETQGLAVSKILASKVVSDAVAHMADANGQVLIAAIPADPAEAATVKDHVAAATLDKPPTLNPAA